MIALLLGLIAAVALVVLLRLLWLSRRPSRATTIITLASVALVVALAALAATGRLHWLAAAFAAILPFLRRGLGLLVRFFPLFGRLFTAFRQRQSTHQGGSAGRAAAMSRQEALTVLGLGANASRQEIIDAHRRLMAKNHPDKGGSTYIAQQLNEAKRTLLG